jgi:glycosyltransferase involved in cell wall biosynthesis
VADILVTHPQLTFGGSEAMVLWTIQALRGDHEITLATTDRASLAELNGFAGTDLSSRDLRTELAPEPFPLSAIDRFDAVRGRLFERRCRTLAYDHDLTICGYNPLRVPGPAIQMIADFSFAEAVRGELTADRTGLERAWTDGSPLRAAYLAALDALLPLPEDDWTRDVVLANSRWSQTILEDRLGVDAELLYPPVPPFQEPDDIEPRELGFVALGRVVREKRTHVAIEILDQLRERGHDVELTIVGPSGEPSYGQRIRQMVDERGDWIRWPGRVSEDTKRRLLAENPYAISGRRREPFGIAVAEVLQAGCIPFVPDEGGQTEIVDDDRLTYASPSEVVDRIEAVLTDETLRSTLQDSLDERRGRFSADRYRREIQATVDRTLKEAASP